MTRSGLGTLVGPGIDLAAYLTAVALSMPPGRAQLVAFAAAVLLGYLPRLIAVRPRQGALTVLCAHAVVVILLAFCLREGVLLALAGNAGRPAVGAYLAAAAATTAVMVIGLRDCALYPQWRLSGAVGSRQIAIGAVVLAVALRLIYAGQVELMPEETYYWNYARHLDIGYLDHPPMVAWLIAAGTWIAGSGELGVRLGAMCSAAVASLFIYRLTREMFGAASALVSVVLMQALPFFFLTGMMITPDSPLTAAWAAALYFLERALIEERRGAWWGAGLAIGLGLLSKYTIVLVGISALLFVLIDPASRRWMRRPQPYAAALLALAVFSPVIWWNAHHDWASFLFQTSRRLADRPQFALHKLMASALVLLTPVGFAAVTMLLARPAAEADAKHRAWLFLKIQTLTPLAVFAAFSLRHEVKLDWTGAPWLGAVPLLAWSVVHWSDSTSTLRRRLSRGMAPTAMVLLSIYAAGLYDFAVGIPGMGYGKHAELVPVGWRELGRQVRQIASSMERQSGQAPLVVGMDRYAIASELAYYSPDQAQGVAQTSSGHLFGQVGLMYERWFPAALQRGRTLLLVAWDPADLGTPGVLSTTAQLGPIEQGELTRRGELIRRYYYRIARGYGEPGIVR